jgi:VWFA-related protein
MHPFEKKTMPFYRFRAFATLVCLLIASSLWLSAQIPDSVDQGPKKEPPQEQEQQQTPPPSPDDNLQVFKAEVNVVNLFFNVKDKHGLLIPNLTKEDFQVFEDGKQQTVKYFSAESNQPLTLGIMIDTSASQTRVLGIEQESCAEFLHAVLRDKDLAFVINFDVDVDLDQDFTNNVRDLTRALNKMQINAGMGGGPPGLGGGPVPTTPRGTLLYDAIYLGANEKLKSEVGRKAMIIFTDGEDQGSRLRIQDAIEAAQKADTICYVILIADRGFYGGFGYSGDFDMRKLAEQTGGRVIEVGNKQDKLRDAFDQIQKELRSQYNIGYTPTNSRQDGSYRKIQIHAKGGEYKVQARQGYYAMARD